jgi:hypothetical protein
MMKWKAIGRKLSCLIEVLFRDLPEGPQEDQENLSQKKPVPRQSTSQALSLKIRSACFKDD